MRLAYIDESYHDDCYWFGAVLVPEDRDAAMQREILAIPGRYDHHGIKPDTEIHGYPLWNATDGWKPLEREPRLRADAMRRTLRAIARAGADVIFVGINRDSPELHVLDVARANAVDELLECIEQHCSTKLSERCLLIFDEETSTSKELFEVVHLHHRKSLVAGNDPRIFERPVIAPSHATPGIQIADVAVYLRRREHQIPAERDSRAQDARDQLMKIIRSRILCDQGP